MPVTAENKNGNAEFADTTTGKTIPVIHAVDVAVVGGSGGAVAAAVAAAHQGATVFLAATRPYLGDDIAGTFRLWTEIRDRMKGVLSKALFSTLADENPGDAPQDLKKLYADGGWRRCRLGRWLTPLDVKKFFDDALIEAGVSFMTGCYGTEILKSSDGSVAGVVIANRSGRQAVLAKVVVDAMPRGTLARHAGAVVSRFIPGPYLFSTRVVSGEAPCADGMDVREFSESCQVKIGGPWSGVRPANGYPTDIDVKLYECRLTIDLPDDSPFSLAEAEQQIRDKAFTPLQQDVAEFSTFVPSDHIVGECSASETDRVDSIPIGAFQPQGIPGIYVLSGMADVSREIVESLLEPTALMDAGERIGSAAATAAANKHFATETVVAAISRKTEIPGEIRELLDDPMPNATTAMRRIRETDCGLPIIGVCDVLVAGGGTCGAPAAIAASRQGMDTILCEYHHDLGGITTVGTLAQYFHGNHCGFTAEMEEPVKRIAANINQGKAEWLRRECRKRNIRILTGSLVCGAVIENGSVTGLVVVTQDGVRGIIRSRVVIDATGNADIAAFAGERTAFIGDGELSLQGATMNKRSLGSNTENTDIGFVDDTDAWDMSFFPLRSRKTLGYHSFWDQSQHVCSRERRRMIGHYTLDPVEVLNGKRFSDTLVRCLAPFDTHGQTVHRLFHLFSTSLRERIFESCLPYRCILPEKSGGLLVIGLGMSVHRDALPLVRMQRDMQNIGYAAGLAASLAVRNGVAPRAVPIRELQGELVQVGILEEKDIYQDDFFPVSDADRVESVRRLLGDHRTNLPRFSGLETLCTDPAHAVSLLRDSYETSNKKNEKVVYAAALAFFGDPTGIRTLTEFIESTPWDKGWNWVGMTAFGPKFSELDGCILVLAGLGVQTAASAVLAKARQLSAESDYSHFRAVALACEALADPGAIPVLSTLLDLPGVRGHHIHLDDGAGFPCYSSHSNTAGDEERNRSLRELALARVLYRLGDDHEKNGEAVLRAYSRDPRSAYAKHAIFLLNGRITNKETML
jgi:NADPH-dependent 2,4-dienoyl-CoA reductase/sulfur reductase-like enzyme